MQHSLPAAAASLSDTSKSWEFLLSQQPGKSSAGSAGVFSPPRLRSSLADPGSANQQLQRIRSGCGTASPRLLSAASPPRVPARAAGTSSCVTVGACAQRCCWLWAQALSETQSDSDRVLKTRGTGSKMS